MRKLRQVLLLCMLKTFSCPLAMADGAARLIEVVGAKQPHLQAAYQHLTTTDPKDYWTSGQWVRQTPHELKI
jgi:acyl-CoA dehydrogenase